MIAQLTGELLEKSTTDVVLDVHGVGYQLAIPLSTADRLPAPGAHLTLYTYLAVREDAMVLYGFGTRQEKELFTLILENVRGFGPRLALNVLSAMPIANFCQAVAAKDLKLLGRINGVGKKSAEQLVLDLKGKLDGLAGIALSAGNSGSADAPPEDAACQAEINDAVAALVQMGLRQEDAQKLVAAVLQQVKANGPVTASSLILLALRQANAAKSK
jgi:Holliday junction DNA helicase RuvA